MALFPSWLALIYGLTIYANAANLSLSPELMNFVPSCAQTCFESFINNNYPIDLCSEKPSLECLCSHNSTSGYTIGEGAVQCIVSEDNVGFCTGSNATNTVVNDAFSMCNGQKSALPNTHSTITATLIIETSQPSIVLVAPNPTSKMVSTTDDSKRTTLQISRTLTKPSLVSSTTTSSSTPIRLSTYITSTTSTTSATASAHATAASSVNALTKPQIAGIVAGGVVSVAVVIGALLLCQKIRQKKRKAARDSELLPFHLDPDNGLQYRLDVKSPKQKFFGLGGTPPGVTAKVPPKIPPRLDNYDMNMFSRRSIRPDTIGLAVSPKLKESPQRRSSKLLPEKPYLTLQIPVTQAREPARESLNYSQPPKEQVYGLNRESTTTQFEEDLESARTGSPMDFRGRRTYSRSENVNTDTWRIFPPPDRNQVVSASPSSATIGTGTLWRPGQPTNKNEPNSDLFVRPLTVRQSVSGTPLSRQPTIPVLQPPLQQQQQREPPRMLEIPDQDNRPVTGSSIYSVKSSLPSEAGRNSNSNNPNFGRGRRKSYKQAGPYDGKRQSESSLTSFETVESAVEPRTTELSPVVESPASGRSPVTYPKIPKRLSGNVIRMVPAPPQPDFTKALREAAQNRTYERPQDSIELRSEMKPSEEYLAPAPLALSKSPSPFDDDYQPVISEELRQAGKEQQRSNSALSNNSASTTSTLLVKRRGSKKAAELTLKSEEDVRKQQRWRVLKDDEIEAARDPSWRPQLGRGINFPQEPERVALPSTPGWVPKLTPTRRGDDLFLSVQ